MLWLVNHPDLFLHACLPQNFPLLRSSAVMWALLTQVLLRVWLCWSVLRFIVLLKLDTVKSFFTLLQHICIMPACSSFSEWRTTAPMEPFCTFLNLFYILLYSFSANFLIDVWMNGQAVEFMTQKNGSSLFLNLVGCILRWQFKTAFLHF